MKKIIALLSFLILTSCSMFNNEAPYKRFFSEKEYPIIKAIHDCDKDKILDMMHKGWNVNSMEKMACPICFMPYGNITMT